LGKRVLIVGGGGREHALGWALSRSPSVDAIESAPGNPGLAELGTVHPDTVPEEPHGIARLAEDRDIDLVVVGPEAPLVAGVCDELRRCGIPAFGPSAAAARIEGSKSFAKDVMASAGVATARHVATSSAPEAKAALEEFVPPYVVKADGLAAGKGVVIAESAAEAHAAIEDALLRRVFGEAGEEVVIEEHLAGPEVSVFAVCDGSEAAVLPPAQDFKRALDGDEGPNTGGMGAYTPVPAFGLGEARALEESLFRPVLRELSDRDADYVGLLYAGLILTDDGPKVLEFNCRFGDPETQVVVPRVSSDLADLLSAAVDPRRGVGSAPLEFSDDAYVTLVLASGGYPGTYEVGHPIEGLEAVGREHPDALVFHAGTRREDGRIVTAGGRVLAVTGRGADLADARETAYAAADAVSWPEQHRREDIARVAAGS
jgi:phosphoribosylamine---glycine ligase